MTEMLCNQTLSIVFYLHGADERMIIARLQITIITT